MKKEDLTMIILVAFSILWTAAFGWGVLRIDVPGALKAYRRTRAPILPGAIRVPAGAAA